MDELVERLLDSKGLVGILGWMAFQYLRRRFSSAAQARKTAEVTEVADSTNPVEIDELNEVQMKGARMTPAAGHSLGSNRPVESHSRSSRQGVLDALTDRVRHFSSEVRHDRRFDSLRKLYRDGVQRPADFWVLEARKDVAAPPDQMRLLRARQQRFERLRNERLRLEVATRISHLEAVARVAMEPVVALLKAEGDGLAAAVPVVHLLPPGERAPRRSRSVDPALGLLELSAKFESGEHILDYDQLLLCVGEGLFFEVSGLAEFLFETLGLAPQVALPAARVEYTEQIAVSALGPMLAGVFAEVFATLRGGPSRVHGLRLSLLQDASLPYVRSKAGSFSGEVPGLLKMEVATLTLHAMGYAIEGEQLTQAFYADHDSALESVMLPRRTDVAVGIPVAFYRSVLGQVVELLVKTPCPALDGYRMVDIPGLAQGPREHEQVRLGAERIRQGGAPKGKALAKMLECVAAMEDPVQGRDLAETLHHALAGLEGSAHSRAVHKKTASGALGIRAGLRNRQILREVVALDAAMSPRASRRDL